MPRIPVLIAAAVASTLLVTACSSTPAQPPADGGTEGLAEFYEQEIEFGPCAPYSETEFDSQFLDDERFDCARVAVPLDYDDPDGTRGEVALLRVPARGEKIGSLLVNPGGPGASGMLSVAQRKDAWEASAVGERFDVIGFDPRGIGASRPRVQCYTDEERDRGEVPGQFELHTEEQASELAERCAEGTGGVAELTSVGSANVVRDMDVIRAVLGDEKLNYLGASYGTELGGMYAEAFPDTIRALVLDGVVPAEKTEPEFREAQNVASQELFEQMAAVCATDATCPLGTDPAGASAAFQALVDPLRESALPVAGGRTLDYDQAVATVSQYLWITTEFPTIIAGIRGLAAGDGSILLAMSDAQYGRGPDGYSAQLSLDANMATRCMDNPRSADEQRALLRTAAEQAPYLGLEPREDVVYECAAWPAPVSRDLPWFTGDVDLPPTLIVSITGDPGTAYEGGVRMAELTGGSLLTVEGVRHVVALYGANACVDEIVADYLVNLETPPEGATCTL